MSDLTSLAPKDLISLGCLLFSLLGIILSMTGMGMLRLFVFLTLLTNLKL